MGIVKGAAAGLAAWAMLAVGPAMADPLGDAEQLRRLDIMLMVTSLRCRATADNFLADYGRFSTAHFSTLNGAAATLRSDLSQRLGAAGANRALDKLSVTMANSYGSGHPWLDCGQLKQVTRDLAAAQGRAPLVEAANQLLSSQGAPQFTWARR